MSFEKENVVSFSLDSRTVEELPAKEIRMILRAADDIVLIGDRRLLAKVLKGSKDRRVLEMQLDKSPIYGCFKELSLEEISAKINWLIKNFYLEIQYSYGQPLLAYTDQGWEIERDTYSDELLKKMTAVLGTGNFKIINELKNRNRALTLLLLDKVKDTKDKRFIPLLEMWEDNDHQTAPDIRKVIQELAGRTVNVFNLEEYRRKKGLV
jgi:superfamily II DNA helicase RecQ